MVTIEMFFDLFTYFYYMTAHCSSPLLSLPNSRAKQITLLLEAA